MNPDILYEDSDILVCIKPAGIPTQTSRIGVPDLVSILKNYLYRSSDKNRQPYLAVIHRLDQPVEGLLVFAKTPSAARSLNRQLTSSGFGKHYLALLDAVPSPEEGTLEHDLVKDARTNTSRVCPPDTPGAKSARLHYKLLRAHSGAALVEILLDTGRHHQIRVQMSHIGCPVTGDAKYGSAAVSSRLHLYAVRLSFRHPKTQKLLTFTHAPELPF